MRRHSRRGTGAAVVVVALAVAGCGSGAGTLPRPAAPSHAGAAVTDSLQLDTTVSTAGPPIHGRLVVVNPGVPLELGRGACRPRFVVVLTNRTYAPVVAWPADCDVRPLRIGHGTTSLAFTVATTYLACQQSGPYHATMPPCTASGPPPLPPGLYRAVVEWDRPMASTIPAPRPETVTLRARS